MHLQPSHTSSPMSTHIMLGGNGEGRQLDNNPMDICTLLNPSDEASSSSHHFQSKIETHQHLINSPTKAWAKQHPQLPPISWGSVNGQCRSSPSYQLPHITLEPRESVRYQSREYDRIPSISHSSPRDLESPSDRQATFHTLYNNDNLAHPLLASGPIHNVLEHSQYLSQSFPADRHQDRHYPNSTTRSSLSPRRRAQQEIPLRESCWNVQRSRVHTPYSPPYKYFGQRFTRSDPHYNTTAPHNIHQTRPNPRHSNKPYTREQVHFIRYHREDCAKTSWINVLNLFVKQFPEYQNLEWPLTVPCLSSRYYRDNKVPMLDEQGKLVLDSNGKAIMIPCKVRERDTEEGKCIPYLFVDMHPDLALVYDWVKPKDKARAMRIVQGLEKEVEETGISEWKRHQQSLRKVDGKS